MTQLLLFDAPASAETVTPAVTTSTNSAVADAGLGNHAKRVGRGPIDDHQPGVHRMGDLARLVLMRYDMVAQRRAELAEQRRAEGRSLPR